MKKKIIATIITVTFAFLTFGQAMFLAEPNNELSHEIPFEDVEVYNWFYNSVRWAFNNGIMYGVSDRSFAPHAEMTRGMLVTILWRYSGMPESSEANFSDVASGRWYSTAISWAAANGIVMGYDENTFGVNDFVNREQMYTILYRYMNFMGLTIILDDEMRVVNFADESEISPWAREAVGFMFDAGIMFRYSSIDFYTRPQENASRGEIATAIYFFNRFALPLENRQVSNVNTGASFQVGNVTLITGSIEHEAHVHFLHGATLSEYGLMSASGLRPSVWLSESLSEIPEIQYMGDIQIIIDGQDGEISTFHDMPEYYNGIRMMPIFAGSFVGGTAEVSLPDEAEAYLLFVDVRWSGGGEEFTLLRYVFYVVLPQSS